MRAGSGGGGHPAFVNALLGVLRSQPAWPPHVCGHRWVRSEFAEGQIACDKLEVSFIFLFFPEDVFGTSLSGGGLGAGSSFHKQATLGPLLLVPLVSDESLLSF